MTPNQSLDRQAVEEEILIEARLRFPEIAAEHPEDLFYVVFFDCELQHTCVLGHLNTEKHLRSKAQLRYEDARYRFTADTTLPEMIEHMRWDGGDFGGHCLFEGPELESVRDAYQSLYAKIGIEAEDALKEEVMRTVCRAVLTMDREGLFAPFRDRCDFSFLCVYQTETIEQGLQRMRAIRNSLP